MFTFSTLSEQKKSDSYVVVLVENIGKVLALKAKAVALALQVKDLLTSLTLSDLERRDQLLWHKWRTTNKTRRGRRFRIDNYVRCVGAHPLLAL